MNDQEILNDTPEGWTHYSYSSERPYFMVEGCRVHVWLGDCWSVPISNKLDITVCSDVTPRPIIERIAELESESADAFVKFAKSYDAIDGRSKLFIHALKIAFDKAKGGTE
jgi:hypothetical protein